LIALVHGTPLASARDVYSFFDAEMIAAARAHAAVAGRFLAVSFMPNAYAGTGGFAGVDVVAAIAAADRLEHARAVATGGTWNTPVRRRRPAVIADETIIGRLAMHRFVATAAVRDFMLGAGGVLDGIGVAVFAADEPFVRPGVGIAVLTATGHHHTDGANDYKCQPKSLHRFSPRRGFLALV
jgi:hypothetical protein